MKAILEFDLPDDEYEFVRAKNAGKISSVIEYVRQHIRSELKYKEHTEAEIIILEKIREIINEEMFEDLLG